MPIIPEDSFNTHLPSEAVIEVVRSDSKVPISTPTPSVICYHIVLAKIATIHNQFRRSLRLRNSKTVELVRTADEQLANIIFGLPAHLRSDEIETSETDRRDAEMPWIPWQKRNLASILLYYRLVINRTLQSSWLVSQEELNGRRLVCLDSAKAIIWISQNWDQPTARRRQW